MKIIDERHCSTLDLFQTKSRNKKRAAALSEVKKQKATGLFVELRETRLFKKTQLSTFY